MWKQTISCCALVALSLPAPSQADVCFTTPIEALLVQSESIVAGEVTASEALGEESGTIDVAVDRVVRGAAVTGPVSIRYAGAAAADSIVGRQALLFVTRDAGTNDLRLVHIQDCSPHQESLASHVLLYPESPLNVPETLRATPDDTEMERVVKELFAAGAMGALIGLARRSIEAPLLRLVSAELLGSRELNPFLNGLNMELHFGGLKGLEELDRTISPISFRAFNKGQFYGTLRQYYTDESAEGIAILERWLEPLNHEQEQRFSAAYILARLGSAPAVAALARGLDDPDYTVSWKAVEGLSQFVNGPEFAAEPPQLSTAETRIYSVPNAPSYGEDPRPYLDFWRSWWRENEAAVREMVPRSAAP